ncbi:MAG TPA: PDZ domain-containing protein [Opitutaceae bacterium]|jgi:tricorn protease
MQTPRLLPRIILGAALAALLRPAAPAQDADGNLTDRAPASMPHALPAPAAAEGTRLMRFPATNDRDIVFEYADQLYSVGIDGGTARRLTNGPGYALFPRFSPDGRTLAFTAQYDGNTEVYEMPAEGGTPRRMTYTATIARDSLGDRMGPNNIVMGWMHTKPEVVFRSRMRSYDPFNGQLFTVGPDGDLPGLLPVPRGGFVSFSPDDTKIAYNRIFREFRTWKDYRGGMADDIWILDLKTGAIEDITNNPAQDIIPMWSGNRIYFLSDRKADGAKRMNLYSYDLSTKETVQHTHFKDYDIKFPSIGTRTIVFEEAGYIWAFDTRAGSAHRVPIAVRDDFETSRPERIEVAKYIEGVDASPDGKRVVIAARGRLFSVPAKDGPTRPLDTAVGVHERDATWSPDGRQIAYISDEGGENELYVRPQDGTGSPVRLTSGADTYYYAPQWSPDNRKLLWADRLQRLRFVDVATKAVTLVDTCPVFEIRQFDWSPDSKWITWARFEQDSLPRVWLYSLDSGRKFPATDGWYEASAPAFSDDGKFLLFASGRDFHVSFSELTTANSDDGELEAVFKNLERVYLVALSKDTDSPFKPKSDEVQVAKADEKKPGDKGGAATADKPKDEKDGDKAVAVKVDEDGLAGRIIGLPVAAANYDDIHSVRDKVYYTRVTTTADDGAPPPKTLLVYDLKERKETDLGTVGNYDITADRKKMLVQVDQDYGIIDLPTSKVEIKDKIPTGGLVMEVDRHAEWAQIFNECWRQMRDFFFSPTMNGADWPAMREKYGAMVPYAQTRYDLTYLVGEMIGEIHSGHTYVGGGDAPEAPSVPLGLLGAELSRDPQSRAYRIDRILPGENWTSGVRSPLTEIGVNVKVGDYILAVDGRPVRDMANIYASLVGKVDAQVVLRVNSRPSDEGARNVTVVPTGDVSPLYYLAWVEHNTAYVSQKTGGRVGYIHIPDMEFEGLDAFSQRFYPQLHKEALVIDDRGNGGGFVSPIVIERLSRGLAMYEKPRNATAHNNPAALNSGPKIVITDEFSASDGDIFPYRFRTLGMGKIVGKRTWGGVVGIRATLPIVDGGFLNKPEFAPYALDGKSWPVEGHGVDPDIVVDNDPSKEFAGTDQQLDRAVEEILAELKTQARPIPPPPPFPDRT